MPVTLGNTSITYNDGTTQSTAPMQPGAQLFSTAGSHNFTVPSGVTAVYVMVAGGGGGGRGSSSSTYGLPSTWRDGGKGASAVARILGLTPGQIIPVTVGAGGAGGVNGSNGGAGGTSSFGSYITCTGGSAGAESTPTAGVATLSNAVIFPAQVPATKGSQGYAYYNNCCGVVQFLLGGGGGAGFHGGGGGAAGIYSSYTLVGGVGGDGAASNTLGSPGQSAPVVNVAGNGGGTNGGTAGAGSYAGGGGGGGGVYVWW